MAFYSVTDYLNLLTSQYRNSANLNAWLGENLNYLDSITTLLDLFTWYFDLDSAEGDQLDIIGSIVGVDRTLTFQPSGGVSSILDDDNYRILIKAKIVKNHWNGQIGSLVEAWAILFPDGQIIITDNQDMSMDVLIVGDFASLTTELVTNGYIVPKPEGVKINYTSAVLPSFGYDLETTYVDGYEIGNWFSYS